MTEPSGGRMDDRNEREGTPPHLTKEQIEGHISAIKSIIKDYNRQNKADLIRLDFITDNIPLKEGRVKPFKEKLKTPLTRRIIEFAGPEYVMPTNITLYDSRSFKSFLDGSKLRRMAHASLVSDVSANIGRRSQGLVRESSTQ
ncbi:hypothetical protein Tco_1047485 [Tanacetum coccineum]